MARQPVTRERVPERAAGDDNEKKKPPPASWVAGGGSLKGHELVTCKIAAWPGSGPGAADEQPGDGKKPHCLRYQHGVGSRSYVNWCNSLLVEPIDILHRRANKAVFHIHAYKSYYQHAVVKIFWCTCKEPKPADKTHGYK